MGELPRAVRRSLTPALVCAVLLATASQPIAGQPQYSTMSIFYGTGWFTDPDTGARRLVALLNVSEHSVEEYPGNASFETFSQTFVQFSIPENASGPESQAGLRVRFSYYVDARCIRLSPEVCPTGENDTSISSDVMDLEVRRVLEYRDGDGNRRYDGGEEVVAEIPLSRPQAPSVRSWPYAENWSALALPYNFNFSASDANLTQGVLYEDDPLLRDLWSFWIAVSDGVPLNLTVNSFLFLRPTTYKGIPLTPTQVKLDLSLGGIEYAANDTALALELVLSSSQFRLQSNGTSASHTLFASSEGAVAFFTWSSNATVDGRSVPVGSTVVPVSNSSAVVYLSYPHGATILHDPVIGVATERLVAGTPGGGPSPVPVVVVIGGAIGVAAAAIAVVALRARRRS